MIQLIKIHKLKEKKLFLLLFLISLLLSHMNIFGISNPAIMPNYFIALILSFLLTNKASLNLFNLVIIGLVIDVLAGNLLGQYGLIFIFIYTLNLITNKILFIKHQSQIIALSIFLIFFSFITLWLTSETFEIFIPFQTLLIQSILTFIVFLFFRVIIIKNIS